MDWDIDWICAYKLGYVRWTYQSIALIMSTWYLTIAYGIVILYTDWLRDITSMRKPIRYIDRRGGDMISIPIYLDGSPTQAMVAMSVSEGSESSERSVTRGLAITHSPPRQEKRSDSASSGSEDCSRVQLSWSMLVEYHSDMCERTRLDISGHINHSHSSSFSLSCLCIGSEEVRHTKDQLKLRASGHIEDDDLNQHIHSSHPHYLLLF